MPLDAPPSASTTRRRVGRCCMIAAAVVVLGVTAFAGAVHRPRPAGERGPEAEALARRMIDAVDGAAWERTGAVRWTFAGQHQHLWDRRRGLARVRWGDVEVLLHAGRPVGRAWRGDARVGGEAEQALVRKAHEAWINDSFWLNPVVKAFDPGTQRARTGDALLVSYTSGGSTPGDAYLWELGPDGRPIAWRMWVSILPLGGVRATWEGWTQLDTGAWVSTDHRILGAIPLRLTDVAGAATLDALEPGPDPFARLLARD